jgi:E3 ubiquitin-protein ligase MYCBP2
VIAKALTVQVRVKGGGSGSKEAQSKGVTTASLATSIHPRAPLGHARWWLRGCISRKLSDGIISLLKDMAAVSVEKSYLNFGFFFFFYIPIIFSHIFFYLNDN